ncbi:hypothetical protein C8R47DRAFT_1125128, partial [Mycena vitilis]
MISVRESHVLRATGLFAAAFFLGVVFVFSFSVQHTSAFRCLPRYCDGDLWNVPPPVTTSTRVPRGPAICDYSTAILLASPRLLSWQHRTGSHYYLNWHRIIDSSGIEPGGAN